MNLQAVSILHANLQLDGESLAASEEFGGRNSAEIETGIFLMALVRRIKPLVILQSGTHFGFSSCWMSIGLKDNWIPCPHRQPGHLYTCDVGDYDQRPEKLWQRCGVEQFATNYVIDSLKFEPPIQFADFIFLDADHGKQFVVDEWNHYRQYFNPMKITVAFHDSRLDPREADAISEIMAHHLPNYRHTAHFAMRNLRGLDLITLSNENY